MTVINTNVKSVIAANALKVNGRAMANAMEQLSTGKRINSASDDAAGMAISESMTAQARGLTMAVRNANDGISMVQTAEGALVEVSNMLQRMRELAVQASTETISQAQRVYLYNEAEALADQITNTVSNTKWNGITILDHTVQGDLTAAGSIKLQIGDSAGVTNVLTITVANLSTASTKATTIGAAWANQAAASAAITTINTGLTAVNGARAALGAATNRLTSIVDNLSNVAQNLVESRSRVMDTDYAAATMELARTQIIQQAGMAVLAQANQQPQAVLALLRG
jgi:flagellin